MININKPTKANLDAQLQCVANNVWKTAEQCHRMYQYFALLTDADLTAYGYSADDIYAIRAACVAFENLYRLYSGVAPLDSGNPSQYIGPLVQTLVV